ncbi:hypothetical protein RZN25_14345 [Bacillaceae bacterium S4-13-56]
MFGLITKLIVCPLTVWISSLLFESVYFPYTYQPLLLGAVIGIIAHIMELWMLRKDTVLRADLLDFVSAILLVYVLSPFMEGAEVTFLGAVWVGVILGITELPQHRLLVKTGRAKKSPLRA